VFPTDGSSVVVANLGAGLSVPIRLQKDALEEDAVSGTSRRRGRSLLQVELATLYVNGSVVPSDGSVLVDNGDQIKIELCASSAYATTTWVDMYVGTGPDAVHDRVKIITVSAPYEMDVNVTESGGGARRLLARRLLGTETFTLERMMAYDVSGKPIPTSDLRFLFDSSVVQDAGVDQDTFRGLASTTPASTVSFGVPGGASSFRLFAVQSSVEIGAFDMDVDDTASASPKTVEFVKRRWGGVAQPATSFAKRARGLSAKRANGRQKSRYFDFGVDAGASPADLDATLAVPWRLPVRFDAEVTTHTDDVSKIVFDLEAGQHDVHLMASEAAYAACDFTDAVEVTDGEFTVTTGGVYHFACSIESHCASGLKQKYVVEPVPSPPPVVIASPPSPPDAPVVVSTQPVVAGPQTFSKLAVYAEQPLATDAELVELRINLADGSRVGNTTVDRIDANTFASTLQLPTYVPETQIALTNTASGWGTESDKKSAYLQIRSDQTGCPVDKCTTEDVCYTAVTIKNDDTLYYGLGNDCNFFYRPSTDRWYGIITSSSAWGWPEPYVDETTNQWTVAPEGGAVQGQWPTSPRPKLFDGDHATVAITGAGPAVKNLMSEGYSFDGGWHSSVYELRLDSVTAQNTLVYKLYNTGTSVWVNSITIEYDLAQRVWRDLGSGNPKAITDTNVHDATSLETSSNPENVYCWESSTSLSVAFNNPYRDLATVAGPLTYDLPYEYSFKLKSHSYAHDDESDPASAADFVCKPSGVVSGVEVNENFNRDGSPAGCKIFNAGDINIGEVAMTFSSATRITTVSMTAQRAKYQPAYDVYENGVLVVSDDTAPGGGLSQHTKTLTWSSVPATQPTAAVSFDLVSPLAATGGRLLTKDGAPSGLALYGSNDDGATWTRVSSLDVVSTARNYGCGIGMYAQTSCDLDVFGPASVGAHVYRFATSEVFGSTTQGLRFGDLEAFLADGTEYVFPASELTILAPLKEGTDDHHWGASWGFIRLSPSIFEKNGTTLFSLVTDKPVHAFKIITKEYLEEQTAGFSYGLEVYRDDVLVSPGTTEKRTSETTENTVENTREHRVSHFVALAGSGTSPAVSELRAYYGDPLRAIVGAHDAREIVDVQLVQSLVAPTIVQNITFTSGPYQGPFEYHSTVNEQYLYELVGYGLDFGIAYDLKTNLWVDHGSNNPDTVTQVNGVVTGKKADKTTVVWVFTDPYFTDPYYVAVQPGTLFDGELDLHPTAPLVFQSAASDSVLLYAQIPKNVIPTSAAVWAEGLVDASLYLADDHPTRRAKLTTDGSWNVELILHAMEGDVLKYKGKQDGSFMADGEIVMTFDSSMNVWTLTSQWTSNANLAQWTWSLDTTSLDGTVRVMSGSNEKFRFDANPGGQWSKLFDAKVYAGYAKPLGANPLAAVTGQYAELGASAFYVNGTEATGVVLSPDGTPAELGTNGKHVVTYVDPTDTFSSGTREVLTGPAGPSLVSEDAPPPPAVFQDVGESSAKTVDASTFFDAGGATLSYSVANGNHALLDATIDSQTGVVTLLKTGSTTGSATITVTATAVETYAQTKSASVAFAFSVISNEAPATALALPDVSGDTVLNLTQYFSDANDGQPLTYSVVVEDSLVVNATLVNATHLRVQNGLFREGSSLVTVTASDGIANVSDVLNASYAFSVSVQFTTEYVYEFTILEPPMSGTTHKQIMLHEILASDADGAGVTLSNSNFAFGVEPDYEVWPTVWSAVTHGSTRLFDGDATTFLEILGDGTKTQGKEGTKIFTLTVQKKLSSVELATQALGSGGAVYLPTWTITENGETVSFSAVAGTYGTKPSRKYLLSAPLGVARADFESDAYHVAEGSAVAWSGKSAADARMLSGDAVSDIAIVGYQGWDSYTYQYEATTGDVLRFVLCCHEGALVSTVTNNDHSILYDRSTGKWSNGDANDSPTPLTHVGDVVTGYQNDEVLFTFVDPYAGVKDAPVGDFTGKDEGLVLSNALPSSGGWAVSFWINVAMACDHGETDYFCTIAGSSGYDSGTGWRLYYWKHTNTPGPNKLSLTNSGESGIGWADPENNWIGKWRHVAITSSNGVWVDGTKVISTNPKSSAAGSSLILAHSSDPITSSDYVTRAYLHDVRYFSRALAGEEVRAVMYDSPFTPYVYEVSASSYDSSAVYIREIEFYDETGTSISYSVEAHVTSSGGTKAVLNDGVTTLDTSSSVFRYTGTSLGTTDWTIGEPLLTFTLSARAHRVKMYFMMATATSAGALVATVKENDQPVGTAMTQDYRVSGENKWIREWDVVPELPGNDIGPLMLVANGNAWSHSSWIKFRLSATGTDAQKGPYHAYYTGFSLNDPITYYQQYGVRYYTNTGTWDGECHVFTGSNSCDPGHGQMTQTADGTVTLYDSSDPPKVMVTFQNPYSSVSSAPALPGPPAVANVAGPTVGSGTLPDLPSVVAPGPDVVFSVASHPTAFDAGNATLRYYFTTDNHALLSIENVDHDAGTATLVPRAAFDLVDAFEPKPKMHLTFEGAAAGDSSRDVIPAGVTVGTYPRGAEGIAAYGSYAADFKIDTHPGDDTNPAERLETGYQLGVKKDLTISVWFKVGEETGSDQTIFASSNYYDDSNADFAVYVDSREPETTGCAAGEMRLFGYFTNSAFNTIGWKQGTTNTKTCINIADWHLVSLTIPGSLSETSSCDVVLRVNDTSTEPLSCANDKIDFKAATLTVAGQVKNPYAGDRYYDELQVWDSALSAQQVSDLYAAFTTPSTSGQATITVKAVAVERAVDSWFADQTFAVTVSAGAPSVALALPDVSGTQTIDLTQYFDDPQGDHTLTYSLTVEDPNVVNATMLNATHLSVQNGLFRDGDSLVTVTASDGFSNVSDALNATYSFVTFSFSVSSTTFSNPLLYFGDMGESLTDSINQKSFTTVSGSPDYDSANNALINSADKFFLSFTDLRGRTEAITVIYELYVPSGSDRRASLAVGADGTNSVAESDSFSWYIEDKMHVPYGGEPAISSSYKSASFQDEWVKLAYVREASENSVRYFVNGVHVGTITPGGTTDLTSHGVVSEIRLFYHDWYGGGISAQNSLKIRNIEVYAASFTNAQMLAALGPDPPPPPAPILPAFGGPNLVSAMSDAVLAVSATQSFSVASHFNTTKLPGSALKYFVTTNNHALLSVVGVDETAGTFDLVVKDNAYGVATVTVKAVAVERDVDQWVATTTFTASVNSPVNDPGLAQALPDVSGTQVIDLTQYFSDADAHDVLSYSLTVEDPNVVNATMLNATHLSVQNGLFRDGNSLVTVIASDGFSNASDALNATYSFLTFSFATEYELTFTKNGDWGSWGQFMLTSIKLMNSEGTEIDPVNYRVEFLQTRRESDRFLLYCNVADIPANEVAGNFELMKIYTDEPVDHVQTTFFRSRYRFPFTISRNGDGASVDVSAGAENDNALTETHVLGAWAPPVPAFGGPNLVSGVPDALLALNATQSFSVASHFNTTKLPGSALKFYVTTDNHALVTITDLDQTAGTFDLVSLGTTGSGSVTVRAVATERDVDAWSALTTFTVSVVVDENDPTVAQALPDVTGAQTIDLSAYFNDTDGFDQLSFTATVSDPSVVTATVDGSSLVLTNGMSVPGSASAFVTVTASDPNATATDALTVTFSFSAGPTKYQYVGFAGIADSDFVRSDVKTALVYFFQFTKDDGTALAYDDIASFHSNMDVSSSIEWIESEWRKAFNALDGHDATATHVSAYTNVQDLTGFGTLDSNTRYVDYYFKLKEPTGFVDGAVLAYDKNGQYGTGQKATWKDAKLYGTNTDPSTVILTSTTGPHLVDGSANWEELCDVTMVKGSLDHSTRPTNAWTSLGATQPVNQAALDAFASSSTPSTSITTTPISDAVVGVNGTRSFSVASRFNASDVSAVLSYHAYVDNHALLAVESMDNAAGTFDLRSLGTAIGSATVIVKAVASVSGSAVAVKTEKFTLTVTADDNDPVRTTTAWPDVSGAQTLDLSAYFNDADGFDQLIFTATSSDASVVTATVDGSSLVLENAMTTSGTSTATVTVTASDPNASVDSTLTVVFSFTVGFRYLAFWGGDFGTDTGNGQTFHELRLTLNTPINGQSVIENGINEPSMTQTKAWTYGAAGNYDTVMDGVVTWDSKLQYKDTYLRANGGVLFYMDMGVGVRADVSGGSYWTYTSTQATFWIGSGKLYGTNDDPAGFTEAQRIDPDYQGYTFICDLTTKYG